MRPRKYFLFCAEDAETDVARVHFFAWYDDGSEAVMTGTILG